MKFYLSRQLVICLLIIAGAALGCGGNSKVKVSGKLTKKGETVQVGQDTLVTILFVPDQTKTQGRTSFPAKFDNSKGTYEVELPRGTYHVNVLLLGGKHKAPPSPNQPKIVLEIQESKNLDIEVPQ